MTSITTMLSQYPPPTMPVQANQIAWRITRYDAEKDNPKSKTNVEIMTRLGEYIYKTLGNVPHYNTPAELKKFMKIPIKMIQYQQNIKYSYINEKAYGQDDIVRIVVYDADIGPAGHFDFYIILRSPITVCDPATTSQAISHSKLYDGTWPGYDDKWKMSESSADEVEVLEKYLHWPPQHVDVTYLLSFFYDYHGVNFVRSLTYKTISVDQRMNINAMQRREGEEEEEERTPASILYSELQDTYKMSLEIILWSDDKQIDRSINQTYKGLWAYKEFEDWRTNKDGAPDFSVSNTFQTSCLEKLKREDTSQIGLFPRGLLRRTHNDEKDGDDGGLKFFIEYKTDSNGDNIPEFVILKMTSQPLTTSNISARHFAKPTITPRYPIEDPRIDPGLPSEKGLQLMKSPIELLSLGNGENERFLSALLLATEMYGKPFPSGANGNYLKNFQGFGGTIGADNKVSSVFLNQDAAIAYFNLCMDIMIIGKKMGDGHQPTACKAFEAYWTRDLISCKKATPPGTYPGTHPGTFKNPEIRHLFIGGSITDGMGKKDWENTRLFTNQVTDEHLIELCDYGQPLNIVATNDNNTPIKVNELGGTGNRDGLWKKLYTREDRNKDDTEVVVCTGDMTLSYSAAITDCNFICNVSNMGLNKGNISDGMLLETDTHQRLYDYNRGASAIESKIRSGLSKGSAALVDHQQKRNAFALTCLGKTMVELVNITGWGSWAINVKLMLIKQDTKIVAKMNDINKAKKLIEDLKLYQEKVEVVKIVRLQVKLKNANIRGLRESDEAIYDTLKHSEKYIYDAIADKYNKVYHLLSRYINILEMLLKDKSLLIKNLHEPAVASAPPAAAPAGAQQIIFSKKDLTDLFKEIEAHITHKDLDKKFFKDGVKKNSKMSKGKAKAKAKMKKVVDTISNASMEAVSAFKRNLIPSFTSLSSSRTGPANPNLEKQKEWCQNNISMTKGYILASQPTYTFTNMEKINPLQDFVSNSIDKLTIFERVTPNEALDVMQDPGGGTIISGGSDGDDDAADTVLSGDNTHHEGPSVSNSSTTDNLPQSRYKINEIKTLRHLFNILSDKINDLLSQELSQELSKDKAIKDKAIKDIKDIQDTLKLSYLVSENKSQEEIDEFKTVLHDYVTNIFLSFNGVDGSIAEVMKKVKDKPHLVELPPPPDPAAAAVSASALEKRDLDIIKSIMLSVTVPDEEEAITFKCRVVIALSIIEFLNNFNVRKKNTIDIENLETSIKDQSLVITGKTVEFALLNGIGLGVIEKVQREPSQEGLPSYNYEYSELDTWLNKQEQEQHLKMQTQESIPDKRDKIKFIWILPRDTLAPRDAYKKLAEIIKKDFDTEKKKGSYIIY